MSTSRGYHILTCKPTGKTPLVRSRRRWEDNIRIGFKKIGINTRNGFDSTQDGDCRRAHLNAALNHVVTRYGMRVHTSLTHLLLTSGAFTRDLISFASSHSAAASAKVGEHASSVQSGLVWASAN